MEKMRILAIDDNTVNLATLEQELKSKYEVIPMISGRRAIKYLYREQVDLILLDVEMPIMDGIETLKEIRAQENGVTVPVIFLTAKKDKATVIDGAKLGIMDYITKPFNNVIVQKRVKNAAGLYKYKMQLEERVEEQTSVLRKAYQALKIQAEKLRENNQQIIDMLGTVVEYRNLESGEHIKRVKGYTGILAECAMKEYPEYGLTKEKINTIVAASSLYDIGKITIPDGILLKPGRLTEDEYEYMKSHTIRGCELLDEIDQEWEPDYKKVSYEICRHHHERYDGKGYPDGLKGEEIPISAQLVSVADVYDALVNERCYKDAYSPDEAYRMIINGECGMFSPKLMEVFRKVRREFEEMK